MQARYGFALVIAVIVIILAWDIVASFTAAGFAKRRHCSLQSAHPSNDAR